MFDSIKHNLRARLTRHQSTRGQAPTTPTPAATYRKKKSSPQLEATMAALSASRAMRPSDSLAAILLPPVKHQGPMDLGSLVEIDEKPAVPVRKPLPPNATLTPRARRASMPAQILLHRPYHRAQKALRKRYQAKFALDIDWLVWCSEEELEKKVDQDISWVRARYAQAGAEEPSDEEVIYWYDAEEYDFFGGGGMLFRDGGME